MHLHIQIVCDLLHAGFLLVLFFDLEYGSDMFHRNFGSHTTYYTASHTRRLTLNKQFCVLGTTPLVCWKSTDVSEERIDSVFRFLAVWFMLVSCLAYFSTSNMEATCSTETSVHFQRTTWPHISEDMDGYKILKTNIVICSLFKDAVSNSDYLQLRMI
jgi:hypothetical protein